jgi:hypothetical protein
LILLLATMIGLGIVAGLLTRGNFKGLTVLRFRLAPVLFVSLVIALLPFYVSSLESSRRAFQLLAFAGVLIFLIANILSTRGGVRAGFLVLGLGWALNFIVIASNGGMPLSLWAYAKSGQTEVPHFGSGGFYRVVEAHPGTVLRPLGDVIPVRVFTQVLSIGDVLLLIGAAIVIAAGMHLRAASERESVPGGARDSGS